MGYDYKEGEYRSYPSVEDIVGRTAVPTVGQYKDQSGKVVMNPLQGKTYVSYAGSSDKRGIRPSRVVSKDKQVKYIIEYRDNKGKFKCAIGLPRHHIYVNGDTRTFPNNVNQSLPLIGNSSLLSNRKHIITKGTTKIQISYEFGQVRSTLEARWSDIDEPSGKSTVGSLLHTKINTTGSGSFTVDYDPEVHPNGVVIDLTTDSGLRYDLNEEWRYRVNTIA